MPFQNFVCWKAASLPRVLNTEALQMDDHFFLATHHPVQMKRADHRSGTPLADAPFLTQEQLLDELIDPRHDYILGAILGAPGTGKSHLVRWLWLHLPKKKNCHIVLVRRGDTLKQVIELILRGMSGPKVNDIKEKLAKAASKANSPRATQQQFLLDLSLAVSKEGYYSKIAASSADPYDQDELSEMMENLPILLRSTSFAKQLLRSEGIISELVDHVLGSKIEGRLNNKRHFSETDIWDESWEINPNSLDVEVRDYIRSFRYDEKMRSDAVAWINKNLETAMARVLELNSGDLLELMAEVRAELQTQDKELLLLIEDLSNLQGIDTALLEALLVRPKQENNLCPLRAIFAVTTGYYANIADNVRERVELTVTLDISEGATIVSSEKLAQFAARYLNAVRLSEIELQRWHSEGANGDAPNHCTLCTFESECHKGFGKEHEIGLYPFTQNALSIMYDRARAERESFNPRVLINTVLRRTLDRGALEIPLSNFPPSDLMATLGRARQPLSAEQTAQIEQSVGAGDKRRAVTLVQLWGDQAHWLQPEIVLEAFDLKMKLRGKDEPTITVPPIIDPVAVELSPKPQPNLDSIPKEVQRRLGVIDAWLDGSILDEPTTTVLRGAIFNSLNSFIDWDSEMFASSVFAGTSKMFQPSSVYFENQQTRLSNRPGVVLTLPLAGQDRSQLALVLKGLLLHNNFGDWNFADGAKRLRMFGDLLERCAAEVLRQLWTPTGDVVEWNAAPLAAELLAIGAQVNGKPSPSESTSPASEETSIEALFSEFRKLEAKNSSRSIEWVKLQNIFFEQGDKVRDHLRSRSLCTKGGVSVGKVLDTASFADSVRRVRSRWMLTATISPTSMRTDAKYLRDLRAQIEPTLEAAVNAEANRFEAWLQRVESVVEAGEGRKEIQNALEAAITAAEMQGVSAFPLALRTAMEGFGSVRLDHCLSTATALREKSGVARLPLVARPDLVHMMDKVERVIEQSEAFLDRLEAQIESQTSSLSNSENISEMHQQITDSLESLCDIFSEMVNTEVKS